MKRRIGDIKLAAEAKTILSFWEDHPDIKLQETTCAQFKKTQAAFESLTLATIQKEADLRVELSERDSLGDQVRLVSTRLRNAIRGIYGPDSREFEQVGGKRLSNYKRPVRRKAPGLSSTNNGQNGNGNHPVGKEDRNEIAIAR